MMICIIIFISSRRHTSDIPAMLSSGVSCSSHNPPYLLQQIKHACAVLCMNDVDFVVVVEDDALGKLFTNVNTPTQLKHLRRDLNTLYFLIFFRKVSLIFRTNQIRLLKHATVFFGGCSSLKIYGNRRKRWQN